MSSQFPTSFPFFSIQPHQSPPAIASKRKPAPPASMPLYQTPDAYKSNGNASHGMYCSLKDFKVAPVAMLSKTTSLMYTGRLVEEERFAVQLCQSIDHKARTQKFEGDSDSMHEDGGFFLAFPNSEPGSRAGSGFEPSRVSSAASNATTDDAIHTCSVDPIVPSIVKNHLLLPSRATSGRSSSPSSSSRDNDEYFQNFNNIPKFDMPGPPNRPTSRQHFLPIPIRPRTTPFSEPNPKGNDDAFTGLAIMSTKALDSTSEEKINENTSGRKVSAGIQLPINVTEPQLDNCDNHMPMTKDPSSTLLSPSAQPSCERRAVSINPSDPHGRPREEQLSLFTSTFATKRRKTSFSAITTKFHTPTPVRVQGYHRYDHERNATSGPERTPHHARSLGYNHFVPNRALTSEPVRTPRAIIETGIDITSFDDEHETRDESPALFLFPKFIAGIVNEKEAPSKSSGTNISSATNDGVQVQENTGHSRYHSMLDSIHCFYPHPKQEHD